MFFVDGLDLVLVVGKRGILFLIFIFVGCRVWFDYYRLGNSGVVGGGGDFGV